MSRPNSNNKSSFNRRRFLIDSVKLAALAGLLAPLEQACGNKSPKGKNPVTNKVNGLTQTNTHNKKHNRKKWHHEGLVINQKTNVVHLPTAATYIFYDEIASDHLQELGMNNWENQVQGKVHFNKDKSGNILEMLSLQKLRNDINNDSLNAAANALSKAFSKDCDNSKGQNSNATNYRLHELMLQLVALNTSIPAENKWQAFNEKVRKPQKIGKRSKWMETETAFNERVKYITDREGDYKKRLNARATKHSFT